MSLNIYRYLRLAFLCLVMMGLSVSAFAGNIIPIKNCEQLQGIGTTTGTLDADYVQVADIDCKEIENFMPIGNSYATRFTGSYNGRGFKIDNLTIQYYGYVGLFGYIENATISDTGLVNYKIMSEKGSIGSLVGNAESSIIRQSYAAQGTVESSNGGDIGGLIGYAARSKVINSYALGRVEGRGPYTYPHVGGLIGGVYDSYIIKTFATGDVVADGGYIGGLIGFISHGSLTNSYATGSVKSTQGGDTGGLVGYLLNSPIKNTYATGLVTGGNNIGGLVGYAQIYDIPVIASYWDTETSGQATSPVGEDRTTAQMKLLDTSEPIYVDWNERIWSIQEGSYPTLY